MLIITQRLKAIQLRVQLRYKIYPLEIFIHLLPTEKKTTNNSKIFNDGNMLATLYAITKRSEI